MFGNRAVSFEIDSRHDGGIPIIHKKTRKEVLINIYDDLHCMDTPSLCGLVGGNEVGSTYFDCFIDGFCKDEKKAILNLSIDKIKKLEISDKVMQFRDKVRILLFEEYDLNDDAFRDYCKYKKFPKIFLLANNVDVDVDDEYMTRNPHFDHFQWYGLQSMNDEINAKFEDLGVVPLLPKMLDKLLTKTKSGKSNTTTYTTQKNKNQSKLKYDDDDSNFKLDSNKA